MRVSYAIVFVSDMSRSVSFYRISSGCPCGSSLRDGASLQRMEPPSRSTQAGRLTPMCPIRRSTPPERADLASPFQISRSSTRR